MNYEVIVVGGGIGGVTTAALLSARGLSVCLLERQSVLGGCVANFEHLDYAFEPTAGLYSGWEPGGVYERVFSQLPVDPPPTDRLSPAYEVRLPDGSRVPISATADQFATELAASFPECAQAAISFYQLLDEVTEDSVAASTAAHLIDCSERFRRFVDVQLQTFTQNTSDQCSLFQAAMALNSPRRGLWAIRGGAQSLADALGESLKKSGGVLRLNSPVLRLAYGADGQPSGVDLLSGERLTATRAIVSNLTVWDTYGKLIGMGRTPPEISNQLRRLQSWGAYLIFLGMDRSAAERLSSSRIIALNDWQTGQAYQPEEAQFLFAAASSWDARAPDDKVAVTVSTFTRSEDWFSFHEDETAHEDEDQSMLETVWARLHVAMPELGDSVEVIETATPRTFYENTRRKLGMVGRVSGNLKPMAGQALPGQTIFPNVFMVGDTSSPSAGLAGVSEAALNLADALTGKT